MKKTLPHTVPLSIAFGLCLVLFFTNIYLSEQRQAARTHDGSFVPLPISGGSPTRDNDNRYGVATRLEFSSHDEVRYFQDRASEQLPMPREQFL